MTPVPRAAKVLIFVMTDMGVPIWIDRVSDSPSPQPSPARWRRPTFVGGGEGVHRALTGMLPSSTVHEEYPTLATAFPPPLAGEGQGEGATNSVLASLEAELLA